MRTREPTLDPLRSEPHLVLRQEAQVNRAAQDEPNSLRMMGSLTTDTHKAARSQRQQRDDNTTMTTTTVTTTMTKATTSGDDERRRR